MSIEQELLDLIRMKDEPEDYDSRQDYLAAITRAIDKLKEDDYDTLSDEAVAWFRAAVDAMNDKEYIPEFEDEDDHADEDDDRESEAEPDSGEARSKSSQQGVSDTDGEGADHEAEVVPDKKASVAKPKKLKGRRPVAPRPAKKPTHAPTGHEDITGEKDKFGIVIGTKTHKAALMYEQGATARQVEDALGGRHRNILKELAKRGHVISKEEGGVWRVTYVEPKKDK